MFFYKYVLKHTIEAIKYMKSLLRVNFPNNQREDSDYTSKIGMPSLQFTPNQTFHHYILVNIEAYYKLVVPNCPLTET